MVRLTLTRTRSSSGSCSVAAAAAFTAVRGRAACLAGPVASAAAPATQTSNLIILAIANLPTASRTAVYVRLQAQSFQLLRVGYKSPTLQNIFPGDFPGLVRTVYEVGALLLAYPIIFPVPEFDTLGPGLFCLIGGCIGMFVFPAYSFYKLAILWGGFCIWCGLLSFRFPKPEDT